MPSTRFFCHLAIFLIASIISKADLASDAAYIAEECLSHHHFEAVKGSLLVFAKQNNLSDDEMAARLLYIANPANDFTNSYGRPMSPAAIGGLCFFTNAQSALPILEKYIAIPTTRSETLYAYGYITQYDRRYFDFIKTASSQGNLDSDFLAVRLREEVSFATSNFAKSKRLPKSVLLMERMLLNTVCEHFDNTISTDGFLQKILPLYTNSIEHVQAQKTALNVIEKGWDAVAKASCYRGEWGGASMSDDEWCQNVSNACQSEIARVMALPEGERLNMTAILDAKIAAIEDGEARAARRATWKRRLRLIGCILLPVSLLTLVAIVLRRRGSGAREMRSSIPEN